MDSRIPGGQSKRYLHELVGQTGQVRSNSEKGRMAAAKSEAKTNVAMNLKTEKESAFNFLSNEVV
jgi:hypothetical protein